MKRISDSIDSIIKLIGNSIAWLTLIMVLLTFIIVVMRYVFNTGSIAAQESVLYMHALVFLLGAAITLQKNEHVRVDIFYQKFSVRGKAFVNIFGILFLLLPVCGFITWSSWDYVVDSWAVKETSAEAGGLPWLYLLKTSILLMVALLSLQAISELIKNLLLAINPHTHNGEETI